MSVAPAPRPAAAPAPAPFNWQTWTPTQPTGGNQDILGSYARVSSDLTRNNQTIGSISGNQGTDWLNKYVSLAPADQQTFWNQSLQTAGGHQTTPPPALNYQTAQPGWGSSQPRGWNGQPLAMPAWLAGSQAAAAAPGASASQNSATSAPATTSTTPGAATTTPGQTIRLPGSTSTNPLQNSIQQYQQNLRNQVPAAYQQYLPANFSF